MIAKSLLLVLAVSFAAAVDDPAPMPSPSEPPAGETDKPEGKPARKKLLRKKGEPTEDKKETEPAKPKDEDAPPPVSERPIPGPESIMEKSDTDDMLEQDLGQDLEAANNEEADPLSRIAQRMQQAEELLARLEETEKAVVAQEDVLKDIEELLKQAQNPPPPGGKSSKKKMTSRQQSLGNQQAQQQKQQAGQRTDQRTNNPSEKIGGPRASQVKTSPQPEERNVWGHLSEMMRGEMSQYAKENFLAKYRDMIERYYTDIAKKSQSRTGP